MDEVWKDIEGYEGVYQVSNTGKVRRLTFTNNQITKTKIHEIKPTDNGNGYLLVYLRLNGMRKNKYVHRLVATAFCERTSKRKYVNHIDHNKHNNNADNLEWCTQKQNVRCSRHLMRHEKVVSKPTNTGEKYISKIQSHYQERYKLYIRRKKICKIFRTLEDAIRYKQEVMRGGV